MPSGEARFVMTACMATIGQVGNVQYENISFGKAGRKRYLGKRPHVRGVVMNPMIIRWAAAKARLPVAVRLAHLGET